MNKVKKFAYPMLALVGLVVVGKKVYEVAKEKLAK